MSAPFLAAKNAGKTYMLGKRALEVLRGIDLEINRGDFLALRGASGAGKSTLLHLLGGLDFPDPGEIHSQGRALSSLSRDDLAQWRNREVGFIFQAYYLLPELDALENVCLPARMARTGASDAARRGRQLLTRVGLSERMEHKPYELSGGEQQRVAIARALINEPRLLLADEPTGNLDREMANETMRLFCKIRERGATIVIATHDVELVNRYGTRVIYLQHGELADDLCRVAPVRDES
jgi:putative ABC transport system ATP-binding protein